MGSCGGVDRGGSSGGGSGLVGGFKVVGESMLLVDAEIKINNKKVDREVYANLEKIKVNLSVDALDVAMVVFYDPLTKLQDDANFDIGKDITISIGSKKYEEIFQGEIVRVDYDFSRGQSPKVHLICYDKLHKLGEMAHSRPFVKMKDSDIAKKMAGEAGLQSSIDTTSKKHDYIFQNNESNLDFLRRRADLIGYELAVDDRKMVFKKARFKDKKKSVNLDWYDTLIDFKVRMDSNNIPEEVMVSSWDYVKKEGVEEKVKAGDEPKVGSAKKMATKEVKSKLKNKSKNYKLDIPNILSGEAKEIAKAKLTASSMNYLKATGSCEGEPKILSGKLLKVGNLGKKLDGEYYITSCEHIYSGSSYRTFFEVISNGTHK